MAAIESTAVALGQGRKRLLTARHAGQALLVTASVIAAISSASLWGGITQATATQKTEAREVMLLERELYWFDKELSEAQGLAEATSADQIADPALLDALIAACGENAGLAQSDARESIAEGRGEIADAVISVKSSLLKKQGTDARSALKAGIESASAALDEAQAGVGDFATVEALENEISRAQACLDDAGAAPELCESALGRLQDAEAACRESCEAYLAQVAASRARTGTAGGGGSTVKGMGAGGAWYASYRGTDNRAYANADGSLSEWKDGYYIAHDWSANGQMIALKPGTVVIDGQTYRYESSQVVSPDTAWDQVDDYVYSGGGIGFQTCTPDGNRLITHYVPQ